MQSKQKMINEKSFFKVWKIPPKFFGDFFWKRIHPKDPNIRHNNLPEN